MTGYKIANACLLHIGTHNVNGALASRRQGRLQGIVRGWCQLNLAVVCVQETHLTEDTSGKCEAEMNEAAGKMQHPGWRVWWSHKSAASAGIGILIRRDMINAGTIKICRNSKGACAGEVIDEGRVMQIAVEWGGHALQIGCVYLTSGDSAAQCRAITHQVGPAWADSLKRWPNRLQIWVGDYNFVEDVKLDRCKTRLRPGSGTGALESAAVVAPERVSLRQQEQAARQVANLNSMGPTSGCSNDGGGDRVSRPYKHPDVDTAALFKFVCPDLRDVFRLMHPVKKSYTYIHTHYASRLDRFMVSSLLQPFVTACGALDNSMVDHRIVGLKILAKPTHVGSGPGLKHMGMQFFCDPEMREKMYSWLEFKVGQCPVPIPGFARRGQNVIDLTGTPEAGAGNAEDGQANALEGTEPSAKLLLAWWQQMKKEMVKKVAAFNKSTRNSNLWYTNEVVIQARSTLQEAVEKLEGCVWDGSNLERVVNARADLAKKAAVVDKGVERECKWEWILSKEKPSRAMSRILSHSKQDRLITALRDNVGGIEESGAGMARIMARFWASISCKVDVSILDQEAVLAPLRMDAKRHIPAEAAVRLGEVVISTEEVKKALGISKRFKASGLDGIITDFYKEFDGIFVHVLAAVFCAMGCLGDTGEGFADGAIITLYKKGDKTMPANYRPITLLNADYRVLGKVMATRLEAALRGVVAVEQTAFLKGRHIGENIMLLQLLPQMLKKKQQSAVIAFCDFAKAYDTIDREFLYRVMECMGAGAPFIRWVKMLLHNTRACAVVNGHVSRKEMSLAGVRQGCPLAPLLYLFVAQALQSWLKSTGLGMDIGPGDRLAAAQYADDTKAFLQSLDEGEVTRFLECMRVFQRASGQKLNEDKTELLPIGMGQQRPPPPMVCNLKVANAARGIGIMFTNNELVLPDAVPRTGRRQSQPSANPSMSVALQAQVAAGSAMYRQATAPGTRSVIRLAATAVASAASAATAAALAPQIAPATMDAGSGSTAGINEQTLQKIKGKFGQISRLGLSAFGRASGGAAFGTSTMLFQAEHIGLPSPAFTSDLDKAYARLVDRGQAPDSVHQALPGLRVNQLHGRPVEGGFGGLPWVEHIMGRHAVAGAELILSGFNAAQPCYRVAVQVLALSHMYLSPLSMLCPNLPSDMGKIPPGPLFRMWKGLKALPPISDVDPNPIVVGRWCCVAPLWGNPLLPPELMNPDFAPARSIAGLVTVGDLVIRSHQVRSAGLFIFQQNQVVWEKGRFESQWMQRVQDLIPTTWLSACVAAHLRIGLDVRHRPTPNEALAIILPRLGWRIACEGMGDRLIHLIKLSVRDATALQLTGDRAVRVQDHAAFINEGNAREVGTVVSTEDHAALHVLFRRCWALQWDNKHKEIFWRLAVDGVADGHHWQGLGGRVCACGRGNPRRQHYFWSCPLAQAVVGEIRRCCPGQPVLHQKHVWLMIEPDGVPEEIWKVVCLSAMNSMDKGRRHLLSLKLTGVREEDPEARSRPVPSQRGNRVALIRSNRGKMELASHKAVDTFWECVSDFAALGRLPSGVSPASPFLRTTHGGLTHHRPQVDTGIG